MGVVSTKVAGCARCEYRRDRSAMRDKLKGVQMYRKICFLACFALVLVWLTGTHGAALGQTPNVRAWGDNSGGELGNGVNSQTEQKLSGASERDYRSGGG